MMAILGLGLKPGDVSTMELGVEKILLAKISTSVLRIPVHVTRTRTAPTLMVLLAVLAEKDSNGMEYLVKI